MQYKIVKMEEYIKSGELKKVQDYYQQMKPDLDEIYYDMKRCCMYNQLSILKWLIKHNDLKISADPTFNQVCYQMFMLIVHTFDVKNNDDYNDIILLVLKLSKKGVSSYSAKKLNIALLLILDHANILVMNASALLDICYNVFVGNYLLTTHVNGLIKLYHERGGTFSNNMLSIVPEQYYQQIFELGYSGLNLPMEAAYIEFKQKQIVEVSNFFPSDVAWLITTLC
jgi:hypothetical protein